MGRRTQQERSAATQKALLDAATRLFAEPGYHAVTMDEIVVAAGVSKGAVYHHYANKRALFKAVLERLARQVRDGFAELASGYDDPYEAIETLLQAFLDTCLQPVARRIGLVDAPGVLGWEDWRTIQFSAFIDLVVDLLHAADARQPLGASPELLAPVLTALCMELSLQIVSAPDEQEARAATEALARRTFDALIPKPAA